jgi:hypothetical protein
LFKFLEVVFVCTVLVDRGFSKLLKVSIQGTGMLGPSGNVSDPDQLMVLFEHKFFSKIKASRFTTVKNVFNFSVFKSTVP